MLRCRPPISSLIKNSPTISVYINGRKISHPFIFIFIFFAISTILPNKGGLCPPGEKSSASENLKEIAPFYADHFEIFPTSPLIAALIFNFPFSSLFFISKNGEEQILLHQMEASKSSLLFEAAEAFGFDIDIVCLCDFSSLGSADFGARARGTFCILFFCCIYIF